MKLIWEINKSDIDKILSFLDEHKQNPFVLKRIRRNIDKNIPAFSKEHFWKAMVSCLLTTQQRSGPNSSVTQFIRSEPFLLSYEKCMVNNLSEFAEKTITEFGGIRRGPTIGQELESNREWLERKGWDIVEEFFHELMSMDNRDTERKWADYIVDSELKGFGPKQSRNLLQSLGLTKNEIPVDSRITKWLTDFGFPLRLSATALADKHYYNFVLDGVQKLCQASNTYPCVLDAAIFSSFDEVWSADNIVW